MSFLVRALCPVAALVHCAICAGFGADDAPEGSLASTDPIPRLAHRATTVQICQYRLKRTIRPVPSIRTCPPMRRSRYSVGVAAVAALGSLAKNVRLRGSNGPKVDPTP